MTEEKKNKPYNPLVSKQHKIHNVDKQVCTVEQKLAYNFALSMRDIIQIAYAECNTGFNQHDIEQWCVNHCITTFQDTRYNLDAIVCIVRTNIKKYVETKGSGILGSYEEIGKMFPCLYQVV